MAKSDHFLGCFLGLAVGDAIGTTVEFESRGSFSEVKDMLGGGPFGLKAGQWTDDTSMALCLATSLVKKKGFDPADQMDRYWRWYQNGYMSSTGECFDIGSTVRSALQRYYHTQEPFSGDTSAYSAGNGSLMRLAPIPIFYFPDLEKTLYFAAESSRTTHGAKECLESCQLFSEMLFNAFTGMDKETLLLKTSFIPSMPKVRDLALGSYRNKRMDDIKGSGYVIECLEAALWCFDHTDSFEDAILLSVNLGDDADTTAAVCGQIAGAYYGVNAIPEKWLAKLFLRTEMESLVKDLITKEKK